MRKSPKRNLRDWPLPEDCLAELGRIAAAWSSLENGMDTYIGKLAGFDLDDPRAFILLKHSSFQQKLDNLSALCVQLAPSFGWLGQYQGTISQIKTAQSLRNRFMHNLLTLNPDTGMLELAVGSARGKLKTSLATVELNDLKQASMTIHKALLALHELVTKKSYPSMWAREGAG